MIPVDEDIKKGGVKPPFLFQDDSVSKKRRK